MWMYLETIMLSEISHKERVLFFWEASIFLRSFLIFLAAVLTLPGSMLSTYHDCSCAAKMKKRLEGQVPAALITTPKWVLWCFLHGCFASELGVPQSSTSVEMCTFQGDIFFYTLSSPGIPQDLKSTNDNFLFSNVIIALLSFYHFFGCFMVWD